MDPNSKDQTLKRVFSSVKREMDAAVHELQYCRKM